MSSIGKMVFDLQMDLAKVQSTPILGPLFASTSSAVIGIAQIVAGLAIAILCGAIGIVTESSRFLDPAFGGAVHVGIGSVALITSAINILTLGYAAQKLENTIEALPLFFTPLLLQNLNPAVARLNMGNGNPQRGVFNEGFNFGANFRM